MDFIAGVSTAATTDKAPQRWICSSQLSFVIAPLCTALSRVFCAEVAVAFDITGPVPTVLKS